MPITPLYYPLNEDEEEIRVINLEPYASPSSLLRCTIETVSLRSFTPKYQDYMSMSSDSGRMLAARWKNLQDTSMIATPGDAAMDKDSPEHSRHRYLWGDYAALSYVWGDPGQTCSIFVNGQVIQIQQNLEGALRTLSSRANFHSRYKLWVDAVCINQQDSQERGRQIGKMRNIYGDTWEVIAWIGEDDHDTGLAFDLIDALSEASFKGCGELLEERLREDPDYLGRGCWIALHDLMIRQYWHRLWIIQEVILGSSSVVLRCGRYSVPWTTFCQAICFLFDYLWNVKDAVLRRERRESSLQNEQHLGHGRPPDNTWQTTGLHLVYRNLWALGRKEEHGGGHHMSFGQLLDIANAAASQNSRDKVYGLVGIMDPAIADNVVPDYTLPTSKVYAAIAKTFMLTHGNLEPLRESNPWGQTKSPSWAADWTWDGRVRHGRLTVTIWGPYWRSKGVPPDDRLATPYCASGDMKMEAYFFNDSLLTCRGFLLDEVDGLAAREAGYFQWAPESIRQPKSDRNAYTSALGVAEALFRALISDRVAEGFKASERHAVILNMPSSFKIAEPQFRDLEWAWLSNQRGYYFRWSGWRKANRSFQVMGKPLDHYFSEDIPVGASEYDYTEVYSCNNRTGQGRRFMTTTNGYLGWVLDNMHGNDENQVRSGDLIAIVLGCSTPIAIRPCGGYFQVLGEAYIQGLMDGEALDFLESGQCALRDFTFC
ncbi:Heterokaryon incompatibility protein [Hyphodiscus hymeniophilus]|uniref:Heterokaryon incompatibility protein n=1 Tax=Hyphodiscus hymeniophilus TaxID=353542 RepID=A0A9P7AW38_9HELO|nr:Heterokaryon incompatibility protein [Hyphodiscus hymeniophilus]